VHYEESKNLFGPVLLTKSIEKREKGKALIRKRELSLSKDNESELYWMENINTITKSKTNSENVTKEVEDEAVTESDDSVDKIGTEPKTDFKSVAKEVEEDILPESEERGDIKIKSDSDSPTAAMSRRIIFLECGTPEEYSTPMRNLVFV